MKSMMRRSVLTSGAVLAAFGLAMGPAAAETPSNVGAATTANSTATTTTSGYSVQQDGTEITVSVTEDSTVTLNENGYVTLEGADGREEAIPSAISSDGHEVEGTWTLEDDHTAVLHVENVDGEDVEAIGGGGAVQTQSAGDWANCNLKSAAGGAIGGAVTGCIADLATGCAPGAAVGLAAGTVGGAASGLVTCS